MKEANRTIARGTAVGDAELAATGSARLVVKVMSGLHRGARLAGGNRAAITIGSGPDCDLVLMDEDVQPAHCRFDFVGDSLHCYAVDGAVACDGQFELAAGASHRLRGRQLLRIGSATVMVRRSRSVPAAPPLERPIVRRRSGWLAWSALVAALGLGGLASIAIASSAWTAPTATPIWNAGDWQAWVSRTLPSAREIRARDDSLGTLPAVDLGGYVGTTRELTRLKEAVAGAGGGARVSAVPVSQMQESLLRLTGLEGVSCASRYLGQGRFACDNSQSSEAAASLRRIARQVPGLTDLELRIAAPAAVPAAPARQPDVVVLPQLPPVTEWPRLPSTMHVFISPQEPLLIDQRGRKYRLGDSIDGFRISRITLTRVEFERDGRKLAVNPSAGGLLDGRTGSGT